VAEQLEIDQGFADAEFAADEGEQEQCADKVTTPAGA
jgi:hypothetical protein